MSTRQPPRYWQTGELDRGHPYRWRSWIRTRLPWALIERGFAPKGEDCDKVGGWHRWYNIDNQSSGCIHCRVVRDQWPPTTLI